MFALICNGLVHELFPADPALDLDPEHAGDLRAVDVSKVSGVAVGWTMGADGTFAAPVVPAPTPAALVAYAEMKQAALAAGGFSFNVAPVGQPPEIVQADTDVSGRLNLAGLVSLAQLNANFTSIWVQAGGGLTLTAAEIIALGQAVGTFVVRTYQTLATVLAGIASGSITTAAQVDAVAWPVASGAVNPPVASTGTAAAA